MVTSPEQFTLSLRQLGISQAQLARHFGLSAVTVSRLGARSYADSRAGTALVGIGAGGEGRGSRHSCKSKAPGNLRMMKLRDAAALALVCWYLQ